MGGAPSARDLIKNGGGLLSESKRLKHSASGVLFRHLKSELAEDPLIQCQALRIQQHVTLASAPEDSAS
jgi:hypothetical protein